MSVAFTTDKNLSLISAVSRRLECVDTKYNYHVFGLVQDNRPPIRIVANDGHKPTDDQCRALKKFFNESGLDVEFCDGSDDTVNIGLRLDVRSKPRFASAIIQTIVFYMEGRLKLDGKFKIECASKVLKPSRKCMIKEGSKVMALPSAATSKNQHGPISIECVGHTLIVQEVIDSTALVHCTKCTVDDHKRRWSIPVSMLKLKKETA
jgi:hypothetical protein